MEFDEMWHFVGSKNKLWVIKAVDRSTEHTVAWVLGGHNTTTFRRLYDKVKRLKDCMLYSDDWDAFAKVLPKERHGKAHTATIEHDNSNIHHRLARFTRRTKVISKSEYMVDLTLRIWLAVTTTDFFTTLYDKLLSIFL